MIENTITIKRFHHNNAPGTDEDYGHIVKITVTDDGVPMGRETAVVDGEFEMVRFQSRRYADGMETIAAANGAWLEKVCEDLVQEWIDQNVQAAEAEAGWSTRP